LGYTPGAEDCFFDIRTEEAVMQFQRQNGLPVTGIADYSTRVMIYSLTNKKQA